MLLLAKAALAMMLGFGLSIIAGLIIIPLLRKKKIGQQVSHTVGERHIAKQGTPTMGGMIFIIPYKKKWIVKDIRYFFKT